jgi:sugar lactone lactonase YvrE
LATFREDGTLRLVSTETGAEVARYRPPGGANSYDWSPDGKLLALATKQGVRLYPSDPERLFELVCAKAGAKGNGKTASVRTSPGGRRDWRSPDATTPDSNIWYSHIGGVKRVT